jgi:hypothetical protein
MVGRFDQPLKDGVGIDLEARCDPQARELLSWRQKWCKTTPTSILTRQELKQAMTILENYDRECLKRPGTLDTELESRGVL